VTGLVPQLGAFRFRAGELALRIGSALVLIPLAVATAYLGGRLFALFWGAAAMGVLWEWMALVAGPRRRPLLLTGAAALALPLMLVLVDFNLAAVVVLALGALAAMAVAVAAGERQLWGAAGIPYAGCLAVAPAVLRSDSKYGFLAIIFLFTIVWTTDIVSYFVGRAVGGPKLAPSVSPNKTWSGAIGGLIAAGFAAIVFAKVAGLSQWFAIAMLGALLSVFAQAGDLFESLLKRRFGAKDSSRIIPGHGGLMDRLDGFIVASVVAALLGLARGGFAAPARGLLMW
jgi:phosphatidate cytidylyltransferase